VTSAPQLPNESGAWQSTAVRARPVNPARETAFGLLA